MRFKATLSRSTADLIKSKIMSPVLAQIVLDVYMLPEDYAALLTKYYEDSFEIEITDDTDI